MAGVVSAGPVTTVVNGSKSPYDVNTISTRNRPSEPRQLSPSSARSPLSSLPPNRKDSNGPGRPTHNRVEELGQQQGQLTHSGSEADSLLDLYRNNASSGNVSHNPGDSDVPENMYRPDDDDPEGWIHRDKLAKIESEELQAAGINLANARRNVNKSGKRETNRGRSWSGEDRNPSESRIVERDEDKQRIDARVEEEDERNNWDLRSPDEIAADHASRQISPNPTLKKSGSKIPVLTSSPLPIPQEWIERDTPILRKRTISGSMSPEDGIPVLRSRKRRGSIGSQPLHDDIESYNTTPVPTNGSKLTPKSASPTKTRPKTAQTTAPDTSAGRKVSSTSRKPSNITKQGTSPSGGQRPGTRSGELDRPRTAVNRPEGDPPWLATMYKPDPRLPPEEQIIPTHARRQQQAQWEQQGAVPTTYDRNFSPLAIHTGNGLVKAPSPIPPSSPSPERQEDPEQTSWPLRPVASVRNSSNGRPGTGGSNHGGYSTMPRVASPAIVQSPRMGNISTKPAEPSRMQVQRLEPNGADEKARDKSCRCCIVM